MTIRSVTSQKAALVKTERFTGETGKPASSGTARKQVHETKPQKIVAVYLNPACEHDWFKLEDDLQTLESEGKTIWKCRTCAEITNTYDWQTPR